MAGGKIAGVDGEERLRSAGKGEMMQQEAKHAQGHGHAAGGVVERGAGAAACELSSELANMHLGDGAEGEEGRGAGVKNMQIDSSEGAKDLEEEEADEIVEEMVKLKKVLSTSKALVVQLGEEIRVIKAEMSAINVVSAKRYVMCGV